MCGARCSTPLWWHAHLPRAFSWLIEGDFVTGLSSSVATATFPIYVALLATWTIRSAWRLLRGPTPSPGKLIVVVTTTTTATWLVGIVLLDGDFAFTVTNVVVHAVPYFGLTHRYARVRAAQRTSSLLARIVRAGPLVFVGLVIALAFVEELGWDRLVWHERGWLLTPRLHREALRSRAAAAVSHAHGVFAAHASARAEVVLGREPEPPQLPLFAADLAPLAPPASRRPWAWLLRRVFAVDVTTCPVPGCGGRKAASARRASGGRRGASEA